MNIKKSKKKINFREFSWRSNQSKNTHLVPKYKGSALFNVLADYVYSRELYRKIR